MTVEVAPATTREGLVEVEAALKAMMENLREIVAQPALTEDGLVRITSIYNNVAYLFLYLEANEEHVDYGWLLPWRDAFHTDDELDARMLHLLLGLRCEAPDAEDSRLAFAEQLKAKARKRGQPSDDSFDRRLREAKELNRRIVLDQRELLKRIGVASDEHSPATLYYQLASTTDSTSTRDKLGRAWTRARDAHSDNIVRVTDAMIEARRRSSAQDGFDTVLARTLSKCTVDEETVDAFLRAYIENALCGHEALLDELRVATGTVPGPDAMYHFPYFMRHLAGSRPPMLLDVDCCLAFAFEAAYAAFGLTIELSASPSPHVIVASVRHDDQDVGHIHFDLWDTDKKAGGANHTQALRNRTDWHNMVQQPVAYVSCRFKRLEGRNLITFQNVHSLYHEFGHGLNHLLITKRLSNQSGLEYLPLERLECMSMWFEKWVYHPAFAAAVVSAGVEHEALASARRLKVLEYRRTYLERAVTAALDFEVHRRVQGGVGEAYAELEQRYELDRYTRLGDYLDYFTWPMFVANPGANFSYLWGAADSCAKFSPLLLLELGEIADQGGCRDSFRSSFTGDVQMPTPESASVFAFYDHAMPYNG